MDDDIENNDIYTAEKILSVKNKKNKKFYLVKWQGWDER